jgi:serine/threonine-protein kinase
MDATRLVRLMKQKHPEIVTIMLTGDTDADTVTSLINQGQIYRFVPKPIRPGYLKLVVNSALAKHRQLRDHPVAAARHTVQSQAVAAMDAALADPQSARATAAAAAPTDGFLDRLVHGLKRLFGR